MRITRLVQRASLAAVVGAAGCSGLATHGQNSGAQNAATLLPDIEVGKAVQVTLARSGQLQWEFTICADPGNANELTVGSLYERADSDSVHELGFYISHDGGNSWALALDKHHRVDPTCAYGPNGKLYAAGMLFAGRGIDYRGLELYASPDYGKTWTTAVWGMNHRPGGSYTHLDRPWLAVDMSGSKSRGTAYFNATEYFSVFRNGRWNESSNAAPPQILLFRSNDGGTSIQASRPRPTPDDVATHPGQVEVLSDGTVVHVFFAFDGKIHLTTSRDGGRTLTPFAEIGGSGKASISTNEPHLADYPYHYIPMLAVDHSHGPYRDRVYVVWMDGSSGRVQMWFTYSLDAHARTWAPPRIIDDAQAFDTAKVWLGPNNCNPAVAVNPAGIVGVLWADRRDNRQRGYWPRFMASSDGGLTWTQSVRVSDRPALWTTKASIDPDAADVNFIVPLKDRPLLMQVTTKAWQPFTEPGDHWGMAADAAGRFHPVWSDDRTGVPQVWTTAITVRDKLRSLEDVTDDIRVRFVHRTYDPSAQRAVVDLIVTNISKHPLSGTLILKSLDPGEVVSFNQAPRENDLRALNASNGWQGTGAYWDLHTDNHRPLAPGASTGIRRLEFASRTAPEPEGTLSISVFAVH